METIIRIGSYVTLLVFLLLSWLLALSGIARVADKTEDLSDELGLAWFTIFLELFVLIGTVVLGGLSYELFEKSKKFITYMFIILTVFTVDVANQSHVFIDRASGDIKTGFEVATAGFSMLAVMNFLFIAVFSLFLEDSKISNIISSPNISPRPQEGPVSTNV